MRFLILLFIILYNHSLLAKEWKSLRQYHKITFNEVLKPSDWLKSDRLNNTLIWQNANQYNLKNNLHQEYTNIIQRRDFYKWLSFEIKRKGNQVVWINMAHFISKKMHLMEVFPFSIFIKHKIKVCAKEGSDVVFKNAFQELKELYQIEVALGKQEAEIWDKSILRKEQFVWLDDFYKTINVKSLRKLERIAKRKFLYTLVIPKEIEFKGNLSSATARYKYALEILRPYCKKAYK